MKQNSLQSEILSPLVKEEEEKQNEKAPDNVKSPDGSPTKGQEAKNNIDEKIGNTTSPQPKVVDSTLKQAERDLRKLQQSEVYSLHYEFQKVLGEGSFCTVYQALDLEKQEVIAVKVIKRKNLYKDSIDLLRQEAELLQSIDHPNIIKFKHIKEIKGKIFLGMELMQDKLSTLITVRKTFSDEDASQIIKCIFEAMEYLHNNNIVHRDLKPDNILIADANDLTTIKIADFGLSAKYEHACYCSLDQQVGTLIFMGPELILKKRYSKGVDVFATGIIMYMLLTGGEHPLYDSRDFQVEKYKKQLLSLQQFTFPSHLSPLAKNIFLRLTKFNITMRYTAAEAIRHPWITRLNKTLIPMTLQDKIENMEIERNFRSKIGMMIFMSNVSQAQNCFENQEFQEYKHLLSRVTKKIEKWHDKFGSKQMHKEVFTRDEEFIELDNSPTKFETSSEEEESDSPRQPESPGLKNPSDGEVRVLGQTSALAEHGSDINTPLSPGIEMSTIDKSPGMRHQIPENQAPKPRKGSLQTRAGGDFKLRLEHANIKRNTNKGGEEQLIQFQEKSPGIGKKQGLLSSQVNPNSPRRKSGYKKVIKTQTSNIGDEQLKKLQQQVSKNTVQTSLNSIAQVTNATGSPEQGSNRIRKNSRNPIIRKDEIIPNNNDVWNYPSPGSGQVVTVSKNAAAGVISRYGDKSNSLINEQLRQQDLKALQKKVASEEKQTIENESSPGMREAQETSRFASGQVGVVNFRAERADKNRRSAIETNENSDLKELCKTYNKEQYHKKRTTTEKEKKESIRDDVSDLSESISSKSISKGHRESGAELNQYSDSQNKNVVQNHLQLETEPGQGDSSQGNKKVNYYNAGAIMTPTHSSLEEAQGRQERLFSEGKQTQQDTEYQLDRQLVNENKSNSVPNNNPREMLFNQDVNFKNDMPMGVNPMWTQPRWSNKANSIGIKPANQEMIGEYYEGQNYNVITSPKAKKLKNKCAKKGQNMVKEINKTLPQQIFQSSNIQSGLQRGNNQQKNSTFSDINQQQPLLSGSNNLNHNKRFDRFSDISNSGQVSDKINFQERQPFNHNMGQPASNRVGEKRNDVYDQKFLFKKNFISKYQPGPATIGSANKNVNQYKMTPSSYNLQNNEGLYKGVHDNYQTGMGNQMYTPNYQISRKSQGSQGHFSSQQRSYIDNPRSIDGGQRTSQTDPQSRQTSNQNTYQANSHNTVNNQQPFKSAFQKNSFTEHTNRLDTETSGIRFSDINQDTNQQNLPDISENQHLTTPQKQPMFQRTHQNKASSAKHTRDMGDSLENINQRLHDSKTPNRIGIQMVSSSIAQEMEAQKSPQSLQRANRSPITNSNIPAQLNFQTQASSGYYQQSQNQSNANPLKKSFTETEKRGLGSYVVNTEPTQQSFNTQSTLMDDVNKAGQTQKVDSFGMMPSSPRSRLLHKKGNSDIKVNKSNQRSSNKKLHTQSQNNNSLFPDDIEKQGNEYPQPNGNISYPGQFRATFPQHNYPQPYQNNNGYLPQDQNSRQEQLGQAGFNRVTAYIKIQNMPATQILSQQQKSAQQSTAPGLLQDQSPNTASNSKLNSQQQMMTNSGKPVQQYGNKIAYQSQNQNRQMRGVGAVNFAHIQTSSMTQNNGFGHGSSQQKRGFTTDGPILQTQPLLPQQQQTQQQVNAQYNSRHTFAASQRPIQTNANNNLAQPNRGRMGVRGFLDPTVGVTGIGISNQLAHHGGFTGNANSSSNQQYRTTSQHQNQNGEDSHLALDIEMGIVGNIQEKAYRQHQSNSNEVNAYRAQYNQNQHNQQNAYMTQNQNMNKKQDQNSGSGFGRQNSDQTAYMRNARAIVQNHNQAMHKNSILFVQCRRITSSSQQVRPPT